MVEANKSNGKSSSDTVAKNVDNSMLQKFFEEGIKDIYYAEKHIIKTLPKMIIAATSPVLKQAFQEHLDVTKIQADRLLGIFKLLGKEPQAKKCEAIEGIMREGERTIEYTEDGTATRDVALILSAQKVEHYEIATYGGLAQLAATLGSYDIAALLTITLDEEKEADNMLKDIAENDLNYVDTNQFAGTNE